MSELPKGWVESQLSQISFIQNGFAFKSSTYKPSGDFVIRIGNVQNGYVSLTNPAYVNANELGAESFRLDKNDILVSLTGNVGRVGKISEEQLPAVLNQRVAKLSPIYEDNRDWLFYLLRTPSFISFVNAKAKGAAQLNISTKDLVNFKFGFPPQDEQARIVEKLDKSLTQVEAIKARLERVSDILKRFRQSVLAAAVSGKLLECKSDTVSIGEVITDIRYGTSKKCEYDGGNTPVLRIPNIGNLKVDANDLKSTDLSEKELEKLSLKEGDILVIRSNGSVDLVAKPALVSKKEEGFSFAGYLIRLRCDKERILPSFLLHTLCSRVVRDVVEVNARSTSGVNNINSKELSALTFSLPSLENQTEIVRLVEQYFKFADSVEAQVKKAQQRVANLTHSILAKAFRGGLVPQNPDDEPAEVLLEKIKKARGEAEALEKAAKKAARAKKKAAA